MVTGVVYGDMDYCTVIGIPYGDMVVYSDMDYCTIIGISYGDKDSVQ